ncbi:MAG: chemotaxis protein CheX [Terriglobales bacterium]
MGLPSEESGSYAALERWRPIMNEAAKEVFSLMVGSPLTPPLAGEVPEIAEVTGMVGLAGELCGILTIRCSASSAKKIASLMLGLADNEAAEQQNDAVGEICNMVAGNFKAKINGLGDNCMLSVPTVISGDNYTTHSLAIGSRMEVPLLFEGEPVWFSLETRD